MKKRQKITMTILATVLTLELALSGMAFWAAPPPPKYNAGDPFVSPELQMTKGYYVLDYKSADVNGDKVNEDVLLVGSKSYGMAIFSKSISLLISNGKSGGFVRMAPKYTQGYGGSLFLGDFNGDKISDIFIEVASGNSGGGGVSLFCIYTLDKGKPVMLYGQDKNHEGLSFKVNFRDKLILDIFNSETYKHITLPIAKTKTRSYLNEIYKEGKLLFPVQGQVDAFCSLVPTDADKDGTYELKGSQYMTGYGRGDAIGMIRSILKYDKKMAKWMIKSWSIDAYK